MVGTVCTYVLQTEINFLLTGFSVTKLYYPVPVIHSLNFLSQFPHSALTINIFGCPCRAVAEVELQTALTESGRLVEAALQDSHLPCL